MTVWLERTQVNGGLLLGMEWGGGDTVFLYPSCPALSVIERKKKAVEETRRKIGIQELCIELLQLARDQKDFNG